MNSTVVLKGVEKVTPIRYVNIMTILVTVVDVRWDPSAHEDPHNKS